MQAEIYVVTTELANPASDKGKNQYSALNIEKQWIEGIFGGITVKKGYIGEWIDEKGVICEDEVEIWRLLTTDTGEALEYKINAIIGVSKRIKEITKQKSQLVTVDKEILPIFL